MSLRRFFRPVFSVIALLAAFVGGAAAPPDKDARTNHDGRTLPAMPKIKEPILFNTPEADAVLAAMQVFPKDNPWNEDISGRPVHKDSDKMIAQIGKDKKLGHNLDMGFIIVPSDQPKVDVKLAAYGEESDPGPYPLPDGAPVEGWPLEGGKLDELQRKGDGDRHVLVVDPVNGKLYEFYRGFKTDKGWKADCEATFDLTGNKLRPKDWTSSDAAGLPIFAAVVRFDEVERGMVEHALRFTVKKTRREYIYPATHQAGKGNDPAVPAMGQRFRLKADADLSGLPKHALAVAKGLQKYGMFVADNGLDWLISVAPDDRIKGLDALRRFKGGDFEVVETTGPDEGPRRK
jgi:hypothetical protein